MPCQPAPHRAVPLDQIDQIQSYLEVLHTFTPLRDDITHSVWIEGKPQNFDLAGVLKAGPRPPSNPCTILAMNTKDFIEDDEDKVTYTLG